MSAITYRSANTLAGDQTEVSAATPLPVTVANQTGASASQVQGTSATAATDDASNPVKVGGVYLSTPATYTNGQRGNYRISLNGSGVIASGGGTLSLAANTRQVVAIQDASGNDSLLGIVPFLSNGTNKDAMVKANATSRITSAANTTNATVAKASAGNVHLICGYNAAVAVRYLKLYNKASAPTVGTDVPVYTIALQPSAAFNIPTDAGLYFSTGIAYALTTGNGDADATAVTAGDILGLNIAYS